MSLVYSLPEHYRKASGVYRRLGQIGADSGLYCIGNQDYRGWYRTKPAPDPWDGTGRPWALAAEYPEFRAEIDRTVYATISYAPRDWFTEAWDRYQWVEPDDPDDDPSREWEGGDSPTPGYGELRAYAPFADIDLSADVKAHRPVGEIPRESVEEALGLYLDGFTELAGDRRHVFSLDSVGGAYVFVAPSSTEPIAEAFDAAGRELIFSELVSRLNAWLDDVRTEVNNRIPAVREVFEPDLLNNKNRLYKAPLSAHSSLDGVVTPVDVERPGYDYTPLEATGPELIASAEEWAVEFTGDHTDAVASIVATLWPEETAAANSWKDALAAWVEAKRVEEREKEEARQQRQERRENRDTDPADLETTDSLDDVIAAVERIDPEGVVRDLCAEWDTANRSGPIRFEPGYRDSKSGTSCYVGTQDGGKIVDLDDKRKAIGVVDYVARETSHIDVGENDTATGKYWWQAVDELRSMEYAIPRLIDEEKEGMSPYYYYNLDMVARRHRVHGDPFDDRQALLSACLYTREENPELADAKPPYKALVAVAERFDLEMADSKEQILGKATHRFAREIFAEMSADDL